MPSAATATALESSSMSLLALKTTGALLLVIGLLLLSLYMLRRFSRLNPARFTQKEDIQLVGKTYVDPKKNISIFQLRNKLLVVGVCESSLTLLTEIDIDEHNQTPFKQVLAQKDRAASSTGHLSDSHVGGDGKSGSGC